MKYDRIKTSGYDILDLTQNKIYEIYDYCSVGGQSFRLRDDVGTEIFSCIDNSAHLNGGNWELFEELPANEDSSEESYPFGIGMPANTKDTNPKDAVGIKKAPMSTVSAPVMLAVGLAMMEGARKYGRHNYRISGVRASVYYDAAMRHLMAWWEGEDLDPDSGLSHIIKAIACMTVLADADMNGKVTDDRPPKSAKGWVQEMNAIAEKLIERHPDALEAYTELKDADV